MSLRVRTWRQTLLQLIRLIRILQDQRVQEAVTSDFKLDLLGFPVTFYASSYRTLSFPYPSNMECWAARRNVVATLT